MSSPAPPEPLCAKEPADQLPKTSFSLGYDNRQEGPTPLEDAKAPPAGLAEIVFLFRHVPGFWRVCAFNFCQCAGQTLVQSYYFGPLLSQVWPNGAASYISWAQAIQFVIAIFGMPLFGMWSDGRPRKTSMVIAAVATFVRYAPFPLVALGVISKKGGIFAYWVMMCLTGSFVSQLSGSPVAWAWMTDTIPLEFRAKGFAFAFGISLFSTWLVAVVLFPFSVTQDAYLWASQVFLVLQLLVIVTMPSLAQASDVGTTSGEEREEADPLDSLSRPTSLASILISPLRLVARKRSLRLICGMAAFITLPDVAVTNSAQLIVMTMMKISGSGHQAEQEELANWMLNFPWIVVIIQLAIVGVCTKRFGPARTLVVWTPISCILLSAPALLGPKSGPYMEFLAGVGLWSPLSLFPPLQMIVTVLVPPSRTGEAMGAVSACKAFASLVAPLVMGAATQALEDNGRTDLFWLIFPAAALVMLAGAWSFSLMLMKRIGTDADVNMSVWSSVSGSHAGRSLLEQGA